MYTAHPEIYPYCHTLSLLDARPISASLNLDDMTIKLGHSRLIEGLSLSVSSGETVTLMGRSGCGKSTLLAWLCGTLAPAFGAEGRVALGKDDLRPEEHTSELQSLMRISYAVFCLKKKKRKHNYN